MRQQKSEKFAATPRRTRPGNRSPGRVRQQLHSTRQQGFRVWGLPIRRRHVEQLRRLPLRVDGTTCRPRRTSPHPRRTDPLPLGTLRRTHRLVLPRSTRRPDPDARDTDSHALEGDSWDPAVRHTINIPRTRPNVLTMEQVHSLVDHTDERYRPGSSPPSPASRSLITPSGKSSTRAAAVRGSRPFAHTTSATATRRCSSNSERTRRQ